MQCSKEKNAARTRGEGQCGVFEGGEEVEEELREGGRRDKLLLRDRIWRLEGEEGAL